MRMSRSSEEIGIEEARKTLGAIADRAHNEGTTTYLTRHNQRIAAVIPVGCRASAVPDSVIDAAMDAAWPGLPDGMTIGEARRRTVAALNAAYPHLPDLLDKAERDAIAPVMEAACERIRQYGVDTGDRQTAAAYERLLREHWDIRSALAKVAAAAHETSRSFRDVANDTTEQ